MKKQILALTLSAAVFTTQPAFAMDADGFEETKNLWIPLSKSLAKIESMNKEELLKKLASLKIAQTAETERNQILVRLNPGDTSFIHVPQAKGGFNKGRSNSKIEPWNPKRESDNKLSNQAKKIATTQSRLEQLGVTFDEHGEPIAD